MLPQAGQFRNQLIQPVYFYRKFCEKVLFFANHGTLQALQVWLAQREWILYRFPPISVNIGVRPLISDFAPKILPSWSTQQHRVVYDPPKWFMVV